MYPPISVEIHIINKNKIMNLLIMKFKLDHIGVVVKDIKKSYDYYGQTFGFKKITKIIYEPAHKVKILFLNIGSGPMPVLELVMPTSKKSKVYNFLKNKGEGFHHYAYEVNKIYKAIDFLKIGIGFLS